VLLTDVLDAIDAVNSADPNQHDGQPLALVQGQMATRWLAQLDSEPSESVIIAARAHHLRRWELARSDYPDGRSGYLQWRRDNKMHQANSAADIMSGHGYSDETIEQVGELLLRKGLGTDPDTQLVEDAACLVFVETQFEEMVERLEHDHMVDVVARTLNKMSPAAIALAAELPMSDAAAAVLTEAVARTGPTSDSEA